MPQQERDVYIIPQNFVDTGTVFGGSIRLRNAVEAAALFLGTAIPICYLPYRLNTRIIIIIGVSLPLAIFGVVGIGGDSLSQFVFHWLRFLFRRRIITPTPEGNLIANRQRHLRFIDGRKYRVLRYGEETELPQNANALPRKKDRHGRLIREETLYDFLPIDKIEKGCIRTTDEQWVKIVEVSPINFLLRSPREQHNVIYSFISLLKVAPVRMQFKTISTKADVNAYLDKLKQDRKQEKYPGLDNQHRDYLRFVRQLGSRDAVSRRFFVIFRYEAPVNERNISENEIISTLETTVRNFATYLRQCGNSLVEHPSQEEFLTEVLYLLLNRRTAPQRPLSDRIQSVLASCLSQSGTSGLEDIPANSFLIPPSIDLKHGKYLVMDGLYHAYLMIPAEGYRTHVAAGWLSLLVNAGEGIDVDFFLERQPKERMVQKIGQQIRINRSRLKETSDTNTDFDDISNSIQSGYYLKEGLGAGEEFYYAAVLVTVTAHTSGDLDWRVGELRKLLRSQDMDIQLCSFRQEAAFLSALPLCCPDRGLFRKYRRNLLTSGAASFYPFVAYELCDNNGVLLGVNTINNSLVSLNIFDSRVYKNANIAVIGTSGAGKTFTTQLIARRMRLAGIPIIVIAPLKGHEFYRLCQALGGTYIRIAPDSPHRINVMEIRQVDRTTQEILDGSQADRSLLGAKIQKLHVFFALRIPDMTYEEKQLLDEAIISAYREKGITFDNVSLDDPEHPGQYRPMPILEDVYNILRETPESHRLANILNHFVNGSASCFNGQTNVSLNVDYVVIDTSGLAGDIASCGTYIVCDYAQDEAQRDRTRPKMIIADEIWRIIGASGNPLAAEFILEMVKTIRGYGGGMLVATQDISDFFAYENGKYGRAILNSCKTKIILNLEEEEARKVQEVLRLTDAEISSIIHFERGNALISSNANNVTVAVRCSDLERKLITTDREELRRIVEERQIQTQMEEST